jgi:biotin carboxyl carrier protein
MGYPLRAARCALTTTLLLAAMAPAPARANAPGGAAAPAEPVRVPGGAPAPAAALTGGSEYGVVVAVSAGKRPVVSELRVPRVARAGRPPRVSLRIDEPGVRTVSLAVAVTDLSSRRVVITAGMGWVLTGRTLTVSWPSGATLKPGRYRVSLSAHDHHAGTLLHGAHSSGEATLTVTPTASKAPAPNPPGSPAPPVPPAVVPETGVLSPAQSAAAGAVFPVAGLHSFGGPENRFGAPRGDHVHEGQDVLAAEGTPIVAPFAGTIVAPGYQGAGAGYYVVEHTAVGFDLMFAHCKAASLAVSTAQAVSAGQQLCEAGQTGSATTPHLHFELWVGEWQSASGHPIDPLPYLEAWDHGGATS